MKSTKRASRAKSCSPSNSSSPLREAKSEVLTSTSSFRRVAGSIKFSTIIRLAFALFLFIFWRVRYGDFLYMAQEYDLFLWNYSYLADASVRIAGLSRYLSSFFVQFFYFPTIGALILVGFSLFIQYATEKIFRLNGWTSVLACLPVCLLTIQITNIRYFLFESCDVAYLFSFIFNLAFALAFAALFSAIRSTKRRVCYLLIATPLTYPIWGFFTLFGVAVCLMIEATAPVEKVDDASLNETPSKKDPITQKRERCELLLLFALAVPALFFLIYADTTPSLRHAYIAGVAEESCISGEVEKYTNDIYRFYVKSFYLVLCAIYYAIVAYAAFGLRKRGSVSGVDATCSPRRRVISRVCVGATLALFCVGTVICSYATREYCALLTMARALDRQDWNKMIAAEARIPAPNDAAISARYLALVRSGRIADELFERPIMPADDPELKSVPAFFVLGDRVLYEYGLTNLAERTASNNVVPKRDRSFWSFKTLVLCALANDRRALALRFLFELKDAPFHRRWALELIDYVFWKDSSASVYDRYATTNGTSEARLQEIDKQFQIVGRQAPFVDGYSPTYGIENMRFTLLVEEDVSRREFEDFEARLVSFLAVREYSHFAPLFDQYLAIKGKERLPRYFQEAALLRAQYPTLFGEESWSIPKEVSIDPEIQKRFDEFMRLFLSTKTDKSAKEKIKREFADTFWRSTMF